MASARINIRTSIVSTLFIATLGGMSAANAEGQFAPQGYNVEAAAPPVAQQMQAQPMYNPAAQMQRPMQPQRAYQVPRPPVQGYQNRYPQQYRQPYANYRRPAPRPQRRNNSGWNSMPWSNSGMNFPMMDGNFVPWSSDVWNWQNRNRNFGAFGPFEQGPQQWATSNPKDGLETMWEDMVNAPHNMGTMPGNWQAPSVSFPNPVDLADQVGVAGKTVMTDAPEVVQDWVTPTFNNE